MSVKSFFQTYILYRGDKKMKKLIIALGVVFTLAITFTTVAFAKQATTTKQSVNEVVNYVYVDIKGEVENPGVYRISDKCRVFQALEMAGGLKVSADTRTINLAAKINDEQVINVPKNGDISVTSLININTATASELDSLPGVGYSTATNIIDYRTNNGSFKTKEEIKLVSGIGDVVYEQIKDLITI